MPTFQCSIEIGRSLAPVYDYFVDSLRDAGDDTDDASKWDPAEIRKWPKTDIETEKTIVSFEPDRNISSRPKGATKHSGIEASWLFQEHPPGVVVTVECVVTPGGIWRLPVLSLIWAPVMWLLRRDLQSELREAKSVLEEVDDEAEPGP